MALHPPAIAVQGIGYSPLLIALQGFAEHGAVVVPVPPEIDLEWHVLSPVWRRIIDGWRDEHHRSRGRIVIGGRSRRTSRLARPGAAQPSVARATFVALAISSGRFGLHGAADVAAHQTAIRIGTSNDVLLPRQEAARVRAWLLMRPSISAGVISAGGVASVQVAMDPLLPVAVRNARALDALVKTGNLLW